MKEKEKEYLELFKAEAHDQFEQLNRLFTALEANSDDKEAIDAIFRITHTLKGNSMGLGIQSIAEISHVMEDIFGEIKKKKFSLSSELFSNLYRGVDKLGQLIQAINTDEKVSYKGIRTKLQVAFRKILPEEEATDDSGSAVVVPADLPNAAETIVATESEPAEAPVAPEDSLSATEEQAVQEEAPAMEETAATESQEAEEVEDDLSTVSDISFSDFVNVPIKKLDGLIDLVGELLIEKDSLAAGRKDGQRNNELALLHRITSDLQYGIMGIRLVQVGFMFHKFHRIIRDVATIEQKEVSLNLEGTEIEIDRNILKILSDSMVHLVRNAVSHGIESPAQRRASGKSTRGNVTLRAFNEKDTVFIEVVDDGQGINEEVILKKAIEKRLVSEEIGKGLSKDEKLQFIFEPGFSNAEKITEVSGRGVGMDVVKRATESIGGRVSVQSEIGKGTVMQLALPSSMALKGALLFQMDRQTYAVPLSYTEAVISLHKKDLHKISNGLMSSYLDRPMSVFFLKDLFQYGKTMDTSFDFHQGFNALKKGEKIEVLVISYQNTYLGFIVDKLLQQKEIVEKTLSKPLDQVPLFSGATILGNGQVCLVLDIPNIIRKVLKNKRRGQEHEYITN
ncbi:chemotaxis protein CheA [Persicobacter psychrovividus]|uniref:Chemotaxis protein CheA n=1 Tax=Persicobacter psychrovividus TaxID=387638 RepID=A0ABN6LF95_9BACT|nr:chemotaxis protein A [Persicobacter psychrovividus]